uniref:C-type lectin domain-containing protein n=1 Tax=Panagrolaimus davidi TaxID=227884 RepID=A0A914QUV7_9BILA
MKYWLLFASFSTIPPTANCSVGYVYFEPTHSCYGRGPEIGLGWNTWPGAEHYCETQGGHLPSLHSLEETHLVVSLAAPYGWKVWVGLYSVDENYSWKWSDATALDYIPWYYGPPAINSPKDTVNCAFAYPYWRPAGSLIIDVCETGNFFVCKIPAKN